MNETVMDEPSIDIFPWDTNFETGIPLVDEQHRQLVSLLNLLVTHLVYQSGSLAIEDVFEQLRQYTVYHFSTEEQLWQSHFTDDAWVSWHSQAHAGFVDELISIRNAKDNAGHDQMLDRIVKFLIHWLAQHILESDKRMAKVVQALSSGISLERAKEQANEEMNGATRVLIETVMGMYDKLAANTVQLSREIHKRKLVEAELVLARQQAEAASRAKSIFLASMSHELRTPMNGIIGMTNLALRDAGDPKLKDKLGKVIQSSQHLLAVINDILDLSKIEAERLTLEQVSFKFGEVLENLLNMLRHKAEEKQLKLLFDLAPEVLHLTLLGDSLRLGQILLNLTSNALKFTDRGSITVRARQLEDSPKGVLLRVEVVDTGIGIAPEDQQRLFTAFEQANDSMTRKYGGTGLGLAISKRLVEMMGGEIGIISTPGQGSTFWFTIRLGKGDDAVRPAPTFTMKSADERLLDKYAGTLILLAEDEPINQEVSRGLLEGVGLMVDLADDGLRALALAKQNTYALILMDMQMPHMNGVEATRAIRALPGNAQTPILAMTANAFDDDRNACLDAGMNDHIAKPVDAQQLYETLWAWLEKSG